LIEFFIIIYGLAFYDGYLINNVMINNAKIVCLILHLSKKDNIKSKI